MLVASRASTEVIDVFIDLNKGTVYLSSELFPFFCMYIVLPFSPKNSIITVVTYANWKLLVIGVKRLEHAMHI
jgi:hypothetical protein